MSRPATCALIVVVAVVRFCEGGFLGVLRWDHAMMFETKPRDRATMAKELEARFGPKVRLLDVPEVNRDVNAIVGIVVADPSVRDGVLYQGEKSVFRFDRVGPKRRCIRALQGWEIDFVRKYLDRR